MIFHLSEVDAYEAPPPATRLVRYLIDPERSGLRRLMSGVTTLEPGQKTNVASHEAEEIYFILEGHAQVRLGDEERVIGPETVMVIASKVTHQIAAVSERVRFLWAQSPAPAHIVAKRNWKRLG